jgi:hypothetical protein
MSSVIYAAAAATISMAELVDVEGVEIVQTGIEYPLASGPRTFTVDDLDDIVSSQDDPAVKTPRLKLGHEADIGILEDGQPAIGTLQNLVLDQDGHLVRGNYTQIPEWLARVLPSAYPARSIEAATGVETPTGHHWRVVLTDLALLGVVWPGVSTLDDIKALYSTDGPDNVRVLSTRGEVEAVFGASLAASGRIAGQVDVDEILRSYREQKSPDQFWWWVRSMYMDPNELIVEDEDSGELYRVPYTVSGEKVDFQDPIPVKIKYVDKPKPKEKEAAALAATAAWESLHPTARRRALYATREEFNRVGATTTEFDPIALRNALGLEDDATDEEVQAALGAAGFVAPPGQEQPSGPARAPAAEQPGTSPAGTAATPPVAPDNQAPAGPQDPAVEQPTTSPSTTPTEPVQAADGTVRLDAETYRTLMTGAQHGTQAFARQTREDRDRVIVDAVADGKIPPSRAEHWEQAWERDPEGTRTLLTASVEQGGLAAGLLPVGDTIGAEHPTEDLTVEAYPSEWLPEVQQRRQG